MTLTPALPATVTGNLDFEWSPYLNDDRRQLCAQILWTLALDFDGRIESGNATRDLSEALERRGIFIDTASMSYLLKSLVQNPQWKGVLGRTTRATVTKELWLKFPYDKLPPNPFLGEDDPEPPVVNETDVDEPDVDEPDEPEELDLPDAPGQLELRTEHDVVDPTAVESNGQREEPLTVNEMANLSDLEIPLTRTEKLSLIISLTADVITEEAAESGAAQHEAATWALNENTRLKEELEHERAESAQKDMRIRELTLALRKMRTVVEHHASA